MVGSDGVYFPPKETTFVNRLRCRVLRQSRHRNDLLHKPRVYCFVTKDANEKHNRSWMSTDRMVSIGNNNILGLSEEQTNYKNEKVVVDHPC